MKFLFIFSYIVFFTSVSLARQFGETEITTEDGIEVFQNEKFYLLKKNVNIQSDSFNLVADNVKINFVDNLYDITKLEAEENVKFNSIEFGLNGVAAAPSGPKLCEDVVTYPRMPTVILTCQKSKIDPQINQQSIPNPSTWESGGVLEAV